MFESLLLSRKSMPTLPWSGPGNKKLLWGDEEFGYFGLLQQSELFTANEIFQEAGLAGSDAVQVVGGTGWFKFIIQGKVVFIRQTPLVTNLSWDTLYEKGLIYGNYTTGALPVSSTASGPANQFVNTTKVEGADTWNLKLRTLNGYELEFGSGVSNNNITQELEALRMLIEPTSGPLYKYAKFTLSQITNGNPEITQSRISTNDARALTYAIINAGGTYQVADAQTNCNETDVYWRPVLELIDATEAAGAPMPTVVTTTEMEGFDF